MSTLNDKTAALETKVEVHPIEPFESRVNDVGSHLCVLTVSDPKDRRKTISNVACRYRIAGSEISFDKPAYDTHESPEDVAHPVPWTQVCLTRRA